MRIVTILTAAAVALGAATAASAATRTVLGTDSVYGAAFSGSGATDSTPFAFSPGPGLQIVFDSVLGALDCCSGSGPFFPPDGGAAIAGGNTDITGVNGRSGIEADRQLFLAGVFVDSTAPVGPPPADLSYAATPGIGQLSYDALVYAPLLGQVFFIGDGQTSASLPQIFDVPDFADTLILGVADGGAFIGAPNFYGDNDGTLTAEFTLVVVDPVAPVPLPAGLPLLLAGLGTFAVLRRAGTRRR